MKNNINKLYFASALSIFATNLGSFLISLLVYEITGSKLATGGLWLIISVTQLFVQFVLGPLLDRWSRKKVMLIFELLRVTMFVGILIAMAFVNNIVLILYIATFLINIAMF